MDVIGLILKDKLFYVVLALVFLIGYVINTNEKHNSDLLENYYKSSGFDYSATHEGLRVKIVTYARSFIGTPYQYSGKGPETFDCSGFTGYVFRRFSIILPSSSASQAEYGQPVAPHQAGPGDLIVFKGPDSQEVGHVGIIVSQPEDSIQFIHSSTTRGVVIDNLAQQYYEERFVGIRRVIGN